MRELIDSTDWLFTGKIEGEAAARLLLFDQDVQSAQIALREFELARRAVMNGSAEERRNALAEMFHSAKTFVCVMRRIGRLGEAFSKKVRALTPEIRRSLKEAWRKKRLAFEVYIDPRNAIEHLDGELEGKTSWRVMNIHDKELWVTDDRRAPVTAEAMELVLSFRAELIQAFNSPNRS